MGEKQVSLTIDTPNPSTWGKRLSLTVFSVTLSGLYLAMGLTSLKRCPGQPLLPYWAVGTGIAFIVGFPVIIIFFSEEFHHHLKAPINEERKRTLCDNVKEKYKSKFGKIKLFLLLAVSMIACAWWIFGCYLAYTLLLIFKVQTEKMDHICDLVVFYITFYLVTIVWAILGLSALWIIGDFVYVEKFRRSNAKSARQLIEHLWINLNFRQANTDTEKDLEKDANLE